MFVKEFLSVVIDEDDEDIFKYKEDVLLRWVLNFKLCFKIIRDLEMVFIFCRW